MLGLSNLMYLGAHKSHLEFSQAGFSDSRHATSRWPNGGVVVRKIVSAVLLPILCGDAVSEASTFTVNPSQGATEIQTVFDVASLGDVVQFSPGDYKISTRLYPPCGATITGPNTSPLTASLSATLNSDHIFFLGDCMFPTVISNLQFRNAGGLFVNAPSNGLTVTNNQFLSLPADYNQEGDMGIYFDGRNGAPITNVAITNNTFGDPSSCGAVMSTRHDEGGLCAGILFQGNLDGVLLQGNVFTHLEEGYHVMCYGDLCAGAGSPSWNNFVVANNDFNNIHRIAMEMQPQNASNVTIQYNSYEDPFAPSHFSMGISAACCAGIETAAVPYINNNLLLANTPPADDYIAYAIEWWGNGAQAIDDLVQGYWRQGIVWGRGAQPWQLIGNVVQGPYMGKGPGCYMCNEKEGATSTPSMYSNVTGDAPSPLVSTAPSISGTTSTVNGTTEVSLSDGAPNHSIFYTTDGSMPTTASARYTGAFEVSSGTTVKAIAMWGQGANPLTYPTGYGFVPSKVVSMTVGAEPPVDFKRLVSVYVTSKGNISAIGVGHTLQFIAHGVYSDGSSGLLPDAAGNEVTGWNTTNHHVAKVSSRGHVTAFNSGTINVQAIVGNIVATSKQIKVTRGSGETNRSAHADADAPAEEFKQ